MKLIKLKKFFKNKLLFYIIQIFVLIFIFVISNKNFLVSQNVSLRSYLMHNRNNLLFSSSTEFEKNKDKIVLVWIDQNFFEKEKISIQWLHRWYYSNVIKTINESNPNVVAIDVLFQNNYKYNWDSSRINALNKIFKSYDNELKKNTLENNVYASLYDFENNEFINPSEDVVGENRKLWHSNSILYSNNLNIWVYWILKNKGGENLLPLSMETFTNYYLKNLNKDFDDVWINYDYKIKDLNNFILLKFPKKDITIPKIKDIDNQEFIFTPIYFNSIDKINYLSFYDIYDKNFDKDLLKDKIVFLGSVDIVTSLNDNQNSLLWTIPWVLFHINQTLSFLNNDFIYFFDHNQTIILLLFLIFLNVLILWLFKKERLRFGAFILLISEIFLIIFLSIILSIGWIYNIFGMQYSIFLPVSTLLYVILFQIFVILIYSFWETTSLKSKIQKVFNLYVSEKITKRASTDNDSKLAEEKNVAMFFSDIKWFTSMSEKLSPQDNIDILNEYFEVMSGEIVKKDGYIDKYIWDSVMAFWEKNTTDNACISAINNILSLSFLNEKYKWDNIDLKIRIWLHYGKVILGDVWSKKYKLNYTIIWDNVNLWSRLESINKFYWTSICMSQEFLDKLEQKNDFIYRKIDKIKVFGKDKPVTIYELFPSYKKMYSEFELSNMNQFIKTFEKWLNNYFEWLFDFALLEFQSVSQFRQDPVAEVFIKRCEKLIKNPPKNWSWVRTFSKK